MTGVAMLISRNRPSGALSKIRPALARGTLAQRALPRLCQFAGGSRGPTARMLCDEPGEQLRVRVAGVEGGNVVVEFTAAVHEQRAIANGDFLQRLETVGRESRTYDADAPLSLAR